MSLTISLASFEASRGLVGDKGSVGGVFEGLVKADRRGMGVLRGKEGINGASSIVWPLVRPVVHS